MLDVRGIPTAECPECSSDLFNITAKFDKDTYELVFYKLSAQCSECGTLLTAPTPIDK
jgi:uncharacterized Zn finger protein